MIDWDEMDDRLESVRRDRRWLAEATPYSWDSIRQALSPSGRARSERMQQVLSRAIEDEEARLSPLREIRPGVFGIFRDDDQLERADRASRLVGAESINQFCLDIVNAAVDRILKEEAEEGIYKRTAEKSPGLVDGEPSPDTIRMNEPDDEIQEG